MRGPASRLAACALLLVVALPLGADSDESVLVTFDREPRGSLPETFRALSSSDDEAGVWQVGRIDGRAVLAQVDLGRRGYRLAALKDVHLKQLRAGIRVRLGDGDQAAGLAWRVRDERNYYAARLDLSDRELIVYKFVRGNRVRLSRLEHLRLDRDDWHTIVVEHVDDRIQVWLNGIPVASERDDSLRERGTLAFWLPGDSTAHFERLWYEPK